jgi:hypothetical protein
MSPSGHCPPKANGHSDKPLGNLTVDTLYAGTDSPTPSSSEFEPAPKDSGAPVTEQFESSLEIPDTLAVVLEMMRREEDDHGGANGNTPSSMWTLIDRH